MVLSDFENLYRLFFKPPLIKGLHFQCVCSVSVVGKQHATAFS